MVIWKKKPMPLNNDDYGFFGDHFRAHGRVLYQLSAQLSRIEQDVQALMRVLLRTEKEVLVAYEAELSAAEAAAKANSDAEASAATLLASLSTLISQLSQPTTDPATAGRITALATSVQSSADALAAAVVANTPAAP